MLEASKGTVWQSQRRKAPMKANLCACVLKLEKWSEEGTAGKPVPKGQGVSPPGLQTAGVHGSLLLTCSLFLFLDLFGNVPSF